MNRYKLTKSGIDYNEAVRRFGGDREAFEQMLIKFLDDTTYDKMIEVMAGDSCEDAFQAAHALKGIVGNLSLVDVYAAILPVVEDLRGGQLQSAKRALPTVTIAYRTAVDAIRDCM